MSPSLRNSVWQKTKGRCWYCGVELVTTRGGYEGNKFTIDHVIPIVKGGDNSIGNLVPSCRGCNVSKCDRSPDQFRAIMGCRKYEIPTFTEEQLAYLSYIGIVLPKPYIPFYFEKVRVPL